MYATTETIILSVACQPPRCQHKRRASTSRNMHVQQTSTDSTQLKPTRNCKEARQRPTRTPNRPILQRCDCHTTSRCKTYALNPDVSATNTLQYAYMALCIDKHKSRHGIILLIVQYEMRRLNSYALSPDVSAPKTLQYAYMALCIGIHKSRHAIILLIIHYEIRASEDPRASLSPISAQIRHEHAKLDQPTPRPPNLKHARLGSTGISQTSPP